MTAALKRTFQKSFNNGLSQFHADDARAKAETIIIPAEGDQPARRIGVSLHDDDDLPARPAGTLDVRPDTPPLGAIVALITREAPEEVIVGLPLNMDGSEGPAARGAQRVAAALRKKISAKVVLWDERRSSIEAHGILHANGRKEKKHRQTVDAVAASLILEGYLGTLR